MLTILVTFTVSFGLAVVLTRVFRDVAIRFGLYDKVEGGRKLHVRPVPRVGGLAVAMAFGLSLVGVAIYQGSLAALLLGDAPLVSALLGGGSLILALGVWDDLFGVRPIYKLAAQVLAALVVCAAGVQIDGIAIPFYGVLQFGWLAIPVTLFWIVLVTNAINLIDGMDGLAGSVVALAGGTLLVMSLIEGDPLAGLLLAAMVAAVLGFLVFNANPASIFLGDAGSLFLGFVLGIVSVHSSQKAYTLFTVVGAVLILALPIFDLSMAVVRRGLTGKPLFAADQHHVHHLLLRRGLSQRQSVLVLIGAAAVVQVLALALIYATDAVSAGLLLLLVPGIGAVVHLLGYTEIIRNGRRELLLKRVLEDAEERENLVLALRRDIEELTDLDVLWARLQEVAAGIGLERMELELDPSSLGFTHDRRRVWQRSSSPEERGIHLANLERRDVPLRIAGRDLGYLRLQWFREYALFAPHDRALHQLVADVSMEALVLVMVRDSRMVNVLPFRPRDNQHNAG